MINYSELKTKSNMLSLFRLLLSVPCFLLFCAGGTEIKYKCWIISIMILAYVTDILDGFLARKYNEITEMGKIIDPLADKLFVGVLAIMLYLKGGIPSLYFWIVLSRDILIFLSGAFTTRLLGYVIPSNYTGKAAVVSIGLILTISVLGAGPKDAYYNYLMYISILLSLVSLAVYAIRAIKIISGRIK